jgi:hypothetical protein
VVRPTAVHGRRRRGGRGGLTVSARCLAGKPHKPGRIVLAVDV